MGRAKAETSPRGGRKSGEKALDDDDLRLWQQVTRNTKPLPRKAVVAAPSSQPPARPPTDPPRSRPSPLPKPQASARAHAPLAVGEAKNVDARTAERLRRGDMAIDARIDLHGHTLEEAHRALLAFVDLAWHRGLRCLLVITGKGRDRESGIGRGVIKSNLPHWLNEAPLRARILAFVEARPKDGGTGAHYLLLKRQREP